MLLGLPDPHPDPLVTRMDPEADPAPDPAWDPSPSHKSVDLYIFCLLLTFELANHSWQGFGSGSSFCLILDPDPGFYREFYSNFVCNFLK
jgi:hypothetical protein